MVASTEGPCVAGGTHIVVPTGGLRIVVPVGGLHTVVPAGGLRTAVHARVARRRTQTQADARARSDAGYDCDGGELMARPQRGGK